MNTFFHFGERVDGYDVPVLNEREVRAGAGILFLLAIVAFMNAWLTGNFYFTRLFVTAFLIDFSIRIFVNPAFSPSMILGRFFVRGQKEEFVGAAPKRFAWSIGLMLALAMFFLIVVGNVIGPLNLVICSACMLLLFFESAFGICIACKVYNAVFTRRSTLCPGGTCEVREPGPGTRIGGGQVAAIVLFLIAIAFVGKRIGVEPEAAPAVGQGAGAARDCTVPAWAAAMGHAEKWKLHNNCKTGS